MGGGYARRVQGTCRPPDLYEIGVPLLLDMSRSPRKQRLQSLGKKVRRRYYADCAEDAYRSDELRKMIESILMTIQVAPSGRAVVSGEGLEI